ncbi:MAG: hypothetical protein PVG50_01410 [Thiohalophilus sp.]|jgi:hypothetical protein
MKKTIAASFLLVAFNAQAADFSYNNASISYANVDIDLAPGISVDGDGLDFEGNFELNNSLFIPVRYQSIGYDYDIDSTMYLFGIGAHLPINNSLDFFGVVQIGNYELEGPGGSIDDDALVLTGGIRTAIANNMEAQAYVTSISFDNDFEDQSGFGGKLNYYINNQISIFGKIEMLSDIDTFAFGAQMDF